MRHASLVRLSIAAAVAVGLAAPARADDERPFPRLFHFHFSKAPLDWYARFDLIHAYPWSMAPALKALNPDLLFFTSFDWMTGPGDSPAEWILRNEAGEIRNDYGPFMDVTRYCGIHEGETWSQHMRQVVSDSLDDNPAADGFISQGVWFSLHATLRTGGVDLDRDGTNDDLDAAQAVWTEGVSQLVSWVWADVQARGKLLILNSGYFHHDEWARSNGVIVEKGTADMNFNWSLLQDYLPWMEAAPEPRVALFDMRGGLDARDDFRTMRSLLTFTLLGDAYFSFTEANAGEHYYVLYYDEYDVDLGRAVSEALRTDICEPSWDGGICCWVRFFERGVSIINATGVDHVVTDADLRSFTEYYDGPYFRFQGGQDPGFNDGRPFDTVTLRSEPSAEPSRTRGEGIILVHEPRTVVADIIVDDVVIGTTPGSEPAALSASWVRDERTYAGGLDPWSVGYRYPGEEWWRYAYADPGAGASAVYAPTIGVPGEYEVFEWHGLLEPLDADDPPPATDVPYTITGAGGATTSGTIDQSRNHGRWNSLGVFRFDAGTGGNVTITDAADGRVMADAFLWRLVDSCTPGAEQDCTTAERCPGVRTCSVEERWGECASRPAAAEVCANGLDDDCNGTADDPAVCGVPCRLELLLTGDDEYTLFVDGRELGRDGTWYDAERYEVDLEPGEHAVAVHVRNSEYVADNPAGLLVDGTYCEGPFVSDASWRVGTSEEPGWTAPDFDDGGWAAATELATYGGDPWARYHGGVVDDFPTGSTARWIWLASTEPNQHAWFRLRLEVPGIGPGSDGGTGDGGDGGANGGSAGCSCSTTGRPAGPALLLAFLTLLWSGRRRDRAPGSREPWPVPGRRPLPLPGRRRRLGRRHRSTVVSTPQPAVPASRRRD